MLDTARRRNWQISGVGIALTALALATLAVRFTGLAAGLPLHWNIDEVAVMQSVLNISLQDLNYHHFVYGSLGFYVLRLATWGMEILAMLAWGHRPSLSTYYMTARLVWATLGSLTVVLVFVLGKRIADWKTGWFSACLFAFSPLAIEVSHYALVETLMGFLIGLALIGVVDWSRGNTRGMYLAGLATGLATATKYNAAIMLFPIVWVAIQLEQGKPLHVPNRRQKIVLFLLLLCVWGGCLGVVLGQEQILRLAASWSSNGFLRPAYQIIFQRLIYLLVVIAGSGLILAAGIQLKWRWAARLLQIGYSSSFLTPLGLALGAFVVLMPFAFLDFPSFAQGFFYAFSRQVEGSAGFLTPGTVDYVIATQTAASVNHWAYVGYLVQEWGWLILVAIVTGMGMFWLKARPLFVPFAGVTLGTLFIASQGLYQGVRYLYPIWIPIVLFGGFGMAAVMDVINQRIGNVLLRSIALASVCGVVFAWPIYHSVNYVQSNYLTPDTTNLALGWIMRNVPAGTTLLREWGTPEVELVRPDLKVYATGYPFEEATLAQWQQRGVTMVLSSTIRYSYYLEHASQFETELAQYEELRRTWKLVYSVEPGADIKGSSVFIYVAP